MSYFVPINPSLELGRSEALEDDRNPSPLAAIATRTFLHDPFFTQDLNARTRIERGISSPCLLRDSFPAELKEKEIARKLLEEPYEKRNALNSIMCMIEQYLANEGFTTLQNCLAGLSEDLAIFCLWYDCELELYQSEWNFIATDQDQGLIKKELFTLLLQKDESGVSLLMQNIAENELFLLSAIAKDPTAFSFANPKLKNNVGFVVRALQANRSVFPHILDGCLDPKDVANILLAHLQPEEKKTILARFPQALFFVQEVEVDDEIINTFQSSIEKNLSAFWNDLLPLDYRKGISSQTMDPYHHLALISGVESLGVSGVYPNSQRYMAKCILDWMQNTHCRLENKDVLVKLFSRLASPETLAVDFVNDYHRAEPVALFTGYQKHMMVILMHKEHLILCNRGEGGFSKGIAYYQIEPAKVTEALIEKILYCSYCPSWKVAQRLLYDFLPKYLNAPSSSCGQMVENALTFRPQKVGNCVHAHTKSVFCLAAFLHTIGRYDLGMLSDDIIKSAAVSAKQQAKVMSYYLRENALLTFRAQQPQQVTDEDALAWKKLDLAAEGKMLARRCQIITTPRQLQELEDCKTSWEEKSHGTLSIYDDYPHTALLAAFTHAAEKILGSESSLFYTKQLQSFMKAKYEHFKNRVDHVQDSKELQELVAISDIDITVLSHWLLDKTECFNAYRLSLLKQCKHFTLEGIAEHLARELTGYVVDSLNKVSKELTFIEGQGDIQYIQDEIVKLGKYCFEPEAIVALIHFNERFLKEVRSKGLLHLLQEDD